MSDSLSFEVAGLPPTEGDERRSAILIADVKSVMKKNGFATIRNRNVRLEIEFHARIASGFSDPAGLISGIAIALEKAKVFSSRSAIRELNFIRNTDVQTRYRIRVSTLGFDQKAAIGV